MKERDALVEILSEILEERGYIDLHSSQFKKDFTPVSREEAEVKAKRIAELLGVDIREDDERLTKLKDVGSFIVDTGRIHLVFAFITEKVEENAG